MIDVHFVILGAACSLLGQAFYIRDTLRGTTHPNRVTWLLWGAAPMLAFAAEVHEGVGLRSLMTFTIGFGPLLVVAASFVGRNALWHITRLDWACGALSVAGTGLWLATRQGAVAIAASIAADALAGVPTLVKSWRAPETETAGAYVGGLANAVLTLLTVTTVSLAVVAFPAYIAAITAVECALVAGRVGPRLRAARRRRSEEAGAPSESPPGSEVSDAVTREGTTNRVLG